VQLDPWWAGVLGDVGEGLLRDPVQRQTSLGTKLVLLTGDGEPARDAAICLELGAQAANHEPAHGNRYDKAQTREPRARRREERGHDKEDEQGREQQTEPSLRRFLLAARLAQPGESRRGAGATLTCETVRPTGICRNDPRVDPAIFSRGWICL
jgi:hypothetical protein